jgi:hypothetical protein
VIKPKLIVADETRARNQNVTARYGAAMFRQMKEPYQLSTLPSRLLQGSPMRAACWDCLRMLEPRSSCFGSLRHDAACDRVGSCDPGFGVLPCCIEFIMFNDAQRKRTEGN